ncbi:MAG: right-handed parallel beta-helix repeat-containing protein [Aquaticitalea sp.]
MKHYFLNILFCMMCMCTRAQHEFHVAVNGTSSGHGSLEEPWGLQTALSQKTDIINGGDTIWLHEGVYSGRFLSSIQSDKENSFVTVAPYQQRNVILNGNVISERNAVLTIIGKQVIFKNFEITCLGKFSRDEKDIDFNRMDGISHSSGEDCKFLNLKIHDNPGSGIGSWKLTAGSVIDGCWIFNNGYQSKVRGSGVGIYVQNQSDKARWITNNIIYNNYYKGVEVWSATSGSKFEFVKNVTLQNNIIFNNGGPGGMFRDNVIIASEDKDGINVAKNIKMLNNILYHNSDFNNDKNFGDGASLSLGYISQAPVENVVIKDNVIIGKNNDLGIAYAKSLTFQDNIVYCGYIHFNTSALDHISNWKFSNNIYYSRTSGGFRILKHKDYGLKDWQSTFGMDTNSELKQVAEFDMENVLDITKDSYENESYRIVLFNKNGNDVMVDFSEYKIKNGASYRIYDIENHKEIAASGIVTDNTKITFPMQLKDFKKPLHNEVAQKTPSNFGVFLIEFESEQTSYTEEKTGFQKFLIWLGF